MVTKTTKIIIGLLLIVIASAITITMMGENVRIKVDYAKTTFYVFENNSWITSGIETNYLYNGTKRIYKDTYNLPIKYSNTTDLFKITRTQTYGKVKIIDNYTFSGSNKGVDLFPVSHTIEIINGSGLKFKYTASNIYYSGKTIYNVMSPQSFGKNMKITWTNGTTKLTRLTGGKGKLDINYVIKSDYERYDVRLFDPEAGWIINGTSVYVDNEHVYLSVNPHTIFETQPVNLIFNSKNYTGDIDLVFGFSNDRMDINDLEVQIPIINTTTEINYTCNDDYFNYTLAPKVGYCYHNETTRDNSTEQNTSELILIFEHSFDRENLSEKTIYWNDTTSSSGWQDYKDIEENYENYSEMNRWKSVKNISAIEGTFYTAKVNVDVPIGLEQYSNKYSFGIKPSNETLQQAIDNEHLFILDPWYSSSWTYKQKINITENSGITLKDYQVKINVTYLPGKMNPDFSDLRFLNSMEDGLIPYYIDRNATVPSASATIYLKMNLTASAVNTAYMYYGNKSAVSTLSNTSALHYFQDMESTPAGTGVPTGWFSYGATNSIVNDSLMEKEQDLRTQRTSTSNPEAGINILNANDSAGYKVVFYQRLASTSNQQGIQNYFRFINSSKNWTTGYQLRISTVQTMHDEYCVGASVVYNELSDKIVYSINYRWEAFLNPNNVNATFNVYYLNNTLVGSFKTNYSSQSLACYLTNGFSGSNAIGFGSYGVNDAKWDYVQVYRYVSPEPSIVFGAETTGQCSPTLNADWTITDQQVCNGVQVTTGTGSIIVTTGNLTLVNGANVTAKNIILTARLPVMDGLKLWVKADTGITKDASNKTSSWTDQSGNGNDFVQGTGTQQPTWIDNTIYGKPVLRMIASASQTMSVNTNFPAPVTVIYVAKMNGGTNARLLSSKNNNWLLGYWSGGKTQAYFEGWISAAGTPSADTNTYIYSAVIPGGASNSLLYENGVLKYSSNAGVTGPNGLCLSGQGCSSEFSDGDVAEIIVYNRTLTDTERSSVENYLSVKYGLINWSILFDGENSEDWQTGSYSSAHVKSGTTALFFNQTGGCCMNNHRHVNNLTLNRGDFIHGWFYSDVPAGQTINFNLYYGNGSDATPCNGGGGAKRYIPMSFTSSGARWYEYSQSVSNIIDNGLNCGSDPLLAESEFTNGHITLIQIWQYNTENYASYYNDFDVIKPQDLVFINKGSELRI